MTRGCILHSTPLPPPLPLYPPFSFVDRFIHYYRKIKRGRKRKNPRRTSETRKRKRKKRGERERRKRKRKRKRAERKKTVKWMTKVVRRRR